MSLSSLIRTSLFSLALFTPLALDAAYTPGTVVLIYGCNFAGDVCFSNGNQPWGSRVGEAYVSPRGGVLEFHGSVWINSGGWTTFDWYTTPPTLPPSFTDSQVVSVEQACITDPSRQYCPLVGYLWGNYAGWIVFGANADPSDPNVTYDKVNGRLVGRAWSDMLGWVPVDGIQVWLTPLGPPYQGPWAPGTFPSTMTTTGSTLLSLNVPPFVEENCRANAVTGMCRDFWIDITPSGYAGLSQSYPYNINQNGFPNVDLSIATTYDYTITDPWDSVTTGTITVYAGVIATTLHPGTSNNSLLIRRLCSRFNDPLYCPDGNTLRHSHVTGDLRNGSTLSAKLADLEDEHTGILRLRDAYGNPIRSEPGVKDVTYTITFVGNLERNTINNTSVYYGKDLAGQNDTAFRFMHGSAMLDPSSFGATSTQLYNSPNQTIGVRSYAPSTAWSPLVEDNDVRVSSIRADIIANPPRINVGEGTLDLTSLFNTNPLPFRPIYEVSSVGGFADIQMGRPTPLSAAISYNNLRNVNISDAHVIHGLSISPTSVFLPNTIATFQDFTSPNPIQCIAYQPGQTSNFSDTTSFCARGGTYGGDESSVISFRANPASTTHSWTTIPRRISTVNLEQSYFYDSVIRYIFPVPGVGPREVIYRSYGTQSTGAPGGADRVFANAVKIIGQASGNQIYQTLTSMPQPKTNTLSRTDIINAIKKNVTILTRNAWQPGATDYTNQNIEVYKRDMTFNNIGSTLATKQTIVVYGDVTIGSGYIDTTGNAPPRVIIALRDESEAGGNIYVQSGVTRLDASLIAERSVISGDNSSGTPRYYVEEPTATGTLNRQLYIYGSVFSENTIGGAAKDGVPTCPRFVNPDDCKDFRPLKYDLEHFRYYRFDAVPNFPAPLARGAASMSADDRKASLIIEYDPRILRTPPPGLENITN